MAVNRVSFRPLVHIMLQREVHDNKGLILSVSHGLTLVLSPCPYSGTQAEGKPPSW